MAIALIQPDRGASRNELFAGQNARKSCSNSAAPAQADHAAHATADAAAAAIENANHLADEAASNAGEVRGGGVRRGTRAVRGGFSEKRVGITHGLDWKSSRSLISFR